MAEWLKHDIKLLEIGIIVQGLFTMKKQKEFYPLYMYL